MANTTVTPAPTPKYYTPDEKVASGRFPGNNFVSRKEVYDYLMTKDGMTPLKAAGIMANIEGESGFYSDAIQTGDNPKLNRGVGLFQHTYTSRKKGMIDAVPNWESNWKGQIDYAMGESEMISYLTKDYDNVQDASKGFMQTFEKPAITSKKYPGHTLVKRGNQYFYLKKKKKGELNKATDVIRKEGEPPKDVRYNKIIISKKDYDDAVTTKTKGRVNSYQNSNFGSNQLATGPTLPPTDDELLNTELKPLQEYKDFYGETAIIEKIDGEDFVIVDYGEGNVIRVPIERANQEVEGGIAVVHADIPNDRSSEVGPASTDIGTASTAENNEEIFTEDDLEEIEEEEERDVLLPQPPMIGPDGQELQPPTADEMNEAQRLEDERLREEERLKREEEEREKNIRIDKRGNDAKEYQELIRRKKQLNGAYKPEDMPAVFSKELRDNDKRMAEIEEEYNLTRRPTDEEFEERRLEIVNNIMSDDDSEDDQTTDDQTTDDEIINELTDEEVDALQIEEEEEEQDDIPNVVDNVVDQNTDQPGDDSFQGLSFNGLGDVADVISQGLGIVDSVRNSIRNKDDLMLAAVGKRAFAESMKKIKPLEVPELSNMFKSHLEQTRQMSQLGFSVEESQKARAEIDGAYGKGIENAVRGTAGDRAKFLAMSGVLDSRRQSALLDFAAKDAQLQRQNQASYTKALSFAEEYNMNKAKVEQSARLETELQNKKGASEFAKQVFQSLDMRAADRALAPYQQYFMSKLTKDGGNPYIPLT